MNNKSFDLDSLTKENKKIIDSIKRFLDTPSKESEKDFIRNISNGNYLIPVKFEGKVKDGIMSEESKISFVTIKDIEGKKFSPIFTDWKELKKWNKEHEQVVLMPYKQAINTLLDVNFELNGLSINPYSQNIVLTPEKVEYIENYTF